MDANVGDVVEGITDITGFVEYVESDNEDNEDLNSVCGSYLEAEDRRGCSFHEFNVEIDLENPTFSIGMLFGNAAVFRKAIREYRIKNHKDLKFKKNDKDKI